MLEKLPKSKLVDLIEVAQTGLTMKVNGTKVRFICCNQEQIDAALWLVTEKHNIAYSVDREQRGGLIIQFNFA